MHIAVKRDKKDMLKVFLKANDELLSLLKIETMLEENNVSEIVPFTTVNIQDIRGRTPLFIAAELDNVSMIKMLITHNANVFLPNKRGVFPIDVAQSDYAKVILNKAKVVSIEIN